MTASRSTTVAAGSGTADTPAASTGCLRMAVDDRRPTERAPFTVDWRR